MMMLQKDRNGNAKFLGLGVAVYLLTLQSCMYVQSYKVYPRDFVQLDAQSELEFYKYEVTNQQFALFLEDIKEESPDLYIAYKPDTSGWMNLPESLGRNEVRVLGRSYHDHPLFANYPTCNITHAAAIAYTEWLTEKSINKKYQYRLPTREEWQALRKSANVDLHSDESQAYGDCLGFNLRYVDGLERDGCYSTCLSYRSTTERRSKPDRFVQNSEGARHIIGNVSELHLEGTYSGGNWYSLPSEVVREISESTNEQLEKLEGSDPGVGFRIVRERVKQEKLTHSTSSNHRTLAKIAE